MALEGRRVLFISYNGLLDPLGQSQVLPYLRALAKLGLKFTILSFERASAFHGNGQTRRDDLQERLAAEEIDWHYLRYHQTPSLPATAFDVANGIRVARRLVKRKQIELVHARSHIPATIALALKRRFGVKLIFDVRGLMADEYVDAGHWQQGSIPYRLTKTMERRALAQADGIVTLTERIWPIIAEWDVVARRRNVAHEVVPCCADLDRFQFSAADRRQRREELGLSDRFVIVYSGSIDGWYLTAEMADFFTEVIKHKPDAHLLWLTPSRHERIRNLMSERGLKENSYSVLSAATTEVASYLSASDAGLAFIKPCFSKLASSPTKYAEYLGCGLPLIINSGIGDSDALITVEGVGALVTEFSEQEYARALKAVAALVEDRCETQALTRAVAERLFDVRKVGGERYRGLYERVLGGDEFQDVGGDVPLDTSTLSHL
jgi:glycosyltransferase involved in cell wall biosynthesis